MRKDPKEKTDKDIEEGTSEEGGGEEGTTTDAGEEEGG